jgi:hypothetical protein
MIGNPGSRELTANKRKNQALIVFCHREHRGHREMEKCAGRKKLPPVFGLVE